MQCTVLNSKIILILNHSIPVFIFLSKLPLKSYRVTDDIFCFALVDVIRCADKTERVYNTTCNYLIMISVHKISTAET